MKGEQTTVNYSVERLSKKNITDLGKLYTAVYAKTLHAHHFAAKYNTAFTSVENLGYIAYDKDLPIAFYGVIPCFMRFDDRIALTAQSADTMTHPAYRNRGLFVDLAQKTFELCRQYDVEFLFGFPNQNSIYGFINRLGWTTTERMSCFVIKSGAFFWRRAFRKLSFLRPFYNSYFKNKLKKVVVPLTGINNSVFSDNYAGILRDGSFLNYKRYAVSHVIKLGTSILWVQIKNEIIIGDISVTPENFDAMIDKLKKFAAKLGIKEIHFHASPGTTLYSLFTARFEAIPSFPVIFKKLDGNANTNRIKFTTADIDIF